MITENDGPATGTQNSTPSLSVESMVEQAEKQAKKGHKVGKRESRPYWQPVRGIIRWEKRQHYYDSSGIRRTRVLETRHSKPRDKKGGIN